MLVSCTTLSAMTALAIYEHDRQSDDGETTTLTPIQRLEAMTSHPVTISTCVSSETLARCHAQVQSPLLRLPAELRQIIFTLATAPSYAAGCVTKRQQFHTPRPGHETSSITCVDLLFTCRRIWLEANHMPMQQAHHCFYLPNPTWEWAEPVGALSELEREHTLEHGDMQVQD